MKTRWLVRIVGGFLSLFFLLFFIGEGIPDIKRSPYPELIYFVPLLFLSIAGYGLSWFREKAGAWLMIAGGTATICYFEIYLSDHFATLVYGLPYVALGVLLLLTDRSAQAS